MESIIYLIITVLLAYIIGNKIDKIYDFFVELWIFCTQKEPAGYQKNGGQLVAEVLKHHGVEHIFTLTGGHISPILVAADDMDIRITDVRHEATAAFAADAYSRLSGKIGVAVVTAGPGLTNTITAIKTAQMNEAPVLLLAGAAPTLLKGRGALQDMDQLSLLRTICKQVVTVKYVRSIVPTLRKAIQCALSDTPGPVFVELPIDVLYPYDSVKEEVIKSKGSGIAGTVIQLYSQWYLRNLFAKAFDSADFSPLPITTVHAAESDVLKCKNALITSKTPVILLGSQVVNPPSKISNLCAAINRLNIPCFMSGAARGLLGRDHSLLITQGRKDALRKADVIILAGAICDFRLSYGKVLNKKAKIIAINTDKDKLKMNSVIFWKPLLCVHGKASDFLIRLEKAVNNRDLNPEFDTIKHNWLKWGEKLKNKSLTTELENRTNLNKYLIAEQNLLNPLEVLFNLEEALDNDTIFVADGGDFVATASYILRPRGPLMWLDPGPFGTLGVGAGYAIGAKVHCPDTNVVILYGDGAAGFSLMEFETFTRCGIHIMAVIGNDACWRQIEREQVSVFRNDVACKLTFADYHDVAKALKAKSYLISKKDHNQLQEIIQDALASYKRLNSVLLNVLIAKTKFRDGSISV